MTDAAQTQTAQARQTFAATDQGRRLLDAFAQISDHLKPQALEMLEALAGWREFG